MITGYNTDVEYDGIVYHVQTEDKGVEHPVILSLVYVDGAILASKRSPYDDLVAGGFDEGILTQRLQRQHKLICAAVQAGRIEDLKRMGERSPQAKSSATPGLETPPQDKESERVASPAPLAKAVSAESARAQQIRPEPVFDADLPLQVTLLEDRELRGGDSVTLRVLVTRPGRNAREPVPAARVALKVLGTTFRPQLASSAAGSDGIASFSVLLPRFTSGRAAILMRVEADGEIAELRRIILPG